MKALVYHGPGKRSWEDKPKPQIQAPTDAIVRITKTTICGTDLHILKGDVPSVKAGRILGHEGVGVVEEVGSAVSSFKARDRVLISCITSCGKCEACKKGMYSHCESGGWILGNTIDGTQAEYVRIPYADNSLYGVPKTVDEDALVMLSDILPTGFECGVLNGQVKPGDKVAIVGAGPVGLAALLTAQFYSPAELILIDLDENRLAVAKTFGATASHGKPVSLKLEKLWAHNITLTTRLVDTVTTPMLLKTVVAGKLPPKKLITHQFRLDELMKAYDTFGNAAKEKALKVLLTAG